MPLPCGHTAPILTAAEPTKCRVCFLYLSDDRYKALYDGTNGKAWKPPKCRFLHRRVRNADHSVKTRTIQTTCCGEKPLDLFECKCPARKPRFEENDQVTLADCDQCPYRPKIMQDNPKALILKNFLSPGDVLTMTAAIFSLHKQHPGRFITAVDTSAQSFFDFNPDVTPLDEARELKAEECDMHYPLVHQCNQRAVHMMQGYCDWLSYSLKIDVPLLTNRPMVYLSREERNWLNQVKETGTDSPFWLVNAGRKDDFTTKFAGTQFFQKLVDILYGKVLFVQVGATEHYHPPLKGVINLVGKTDQRQLLRLCWHAKGGVGGTTMLMHLMGAVEKPYMCLLGGREPVQWNSYPKSQVFHTIGMLPCCATDSCWRSRTVKLNDGSNEDNSLCANPIPSGDEMVPKCLAMISPQEVAERILRFPA